MKKDTLQGCIDEAHRFLVRAKELQLHQKWLEHEAERDENEAWRLRGSHFNLWFPGMSKRTAAVRRASLDLTHRLADLRQER